MMDRILSNRFVSPVILVLLIAAGAFYFYELTLLKNELVASQDYLMKLSEQDSKRIERLQATINTLEESCISAINASSTVESGETVEEDEPEL